jgi:ketosteroid isomerase-like protein
MSQENVEIVQRVTIDGDYVPIFRDDEGWAALAEAIAPYYREDVECRAVRFDDETTYKGLVGFRALWLDWLAPWASYRVELHDLVDLGDQVLVPAYNFGRLHDSSEEIRMDAAAVFTFHDGKVAHAAFYADRAEALTAVGLEE